MTPRAFAVVPAAGSGVRMGGPVRKQYRLLAGRPVISHTLDALFRCPRIETVFLVVPEADRAPAEALVADLPDPARVAVVDGGERRQDSVWSGLSAAGAAGFLQDDVAVIHDGVRPFISPEKIDESIESAKASGACILAVPAADTLKKTDGRGNILATVDRKSIWLAQTPQSFVLSLILAAHKAARRDGFTGTDDASLVERLGGTVRIVEGSRMNIKITTEPDMALAEAWLAAGAGAGRD